MPACICNNIHYKAWDEITNPFPIINGTIVEVLEWISILKPHFTVHVIIHPYLGLKLTHVNRWGRGPQCVKGNACIYKNIVGISQHGQSVETKLPTNDADLNAYMPWWRHQMETFPCYWPFVWGIHRWPVNSPHKGQWRGALIFYLICVWTNVWVNNGDAGDLRSKSSLLLWRRCNDNNMPQYDCPSASDATLKNMCKTWPVPEHNKIQ